MLQPEPPAWQSVDRSAETVNLFFEVEFVDAADDQGPLIDLLRLGVGSCGNVAL